MQVQTAPMSVIGRTPVRKVLRGNTMKPRQGVLRERRRSCWCTIRPEIRQLYRKVLRKLPIAVLRHSCRTSVANPDKMTRVGEVDSIYVFILQTVNSELHLPRYL